VVYSKHLLDVWSILNCFGREVMMSLAREGSIRKIARCANFNDQVEVLDKSRDDDEPSLPMNRKVVCRSDAYLRLSELA
jgi:hypothetical protein